MNKHRNGLTGGISNIYKECKMNHLILVRGLPGSGKSTFAHMMSHHGFLHVEADMFFVGPDGYKFNGLKIADAHDWCQKEVVRALDHGENVIVSNTFTQKWEIEPYQKMVEKTGCKLTIIKMEGNYGSVHGIPEIALQKMKDRWEELV